jgi:arachidonate 15-lipoxygenase
MNPTLPQNATDPARRQSALDRARSSYEYDFSYEDLCFVKDLPLRERFTPRYIAKAVEIEVALKVNRAAASLEDWLRPGTARYEAMFPTLAAPLARASWMPDWCFGWQRVAGPVPQLLCRIDTLPACLPVADTDVARALASGRMYAVDYSCFDGVPGGVTDGHQKYLWAPVALFCADPATPGGMRPVAIQTAGQRGGRDTLVTPADGIRWQAARTAVQVADENQQGIIAHIGWCHFIVQRFILAGHRQLSADHPLLVLLAPHFEYTLSVNQVAHESVIGPGGSQDRLLAPPIDRQIAVLNAALDQVDLASLDPTIEFARRGVADREALPAYPFRDDGLPAWEALQAFVGAYVRLYYTSDADVVADTELAAFLREVGAPDGGRLPNLIAGVSLATVDDVAQLIARILFRATTFHASINDASYDWVSFAPNMPTAGFAPLPGPNGTQAEWEAMLPPMALAWETISATYNVAELKVSRLGEYGDGYFADPRVAPILARYQAALSAIEQGITERNARRPLPYTFLLPSRVTRSISA